MVQAGGVVGGGPTTEYPCSMATNPRAGTPSPPSRFGAPPSPGQPGLNSMRTRRFWLTLIGLLVLNYIISSLLLGTGQPKSVTITYNVFLQQVSGDNVVSIN